MQDPTGTNLDKYGEGWMFEPKTQSTADAPPALLEPPQYMEHLTTAWASRSRTIKGQANA
ncbi:MAG: hypothetical protein R3C56_14395 [Pirellulaceae bacterium]